VAVGNLGKETGKGKRGTLHYQKIVKIPNGAGILADKLKIPVSNNSVWVSEGKNANRLRYLAESSRSKNINRVDSIRNSTHGKIRTSSSTN